MFHSGIDYGRGVSNRNPKTGIRFGIINQHSLADWVMSEAETIYWHGCPECGNEFKTKSDVVRCPTCRYESDDTSEFYGDEPLAWIIAKSKTEFIHTEDPTFGVWVERSPYYTLCSMCSPCAPGAGDLDSPNEDGVKTYCLGPDYFDGDNPCPYPIYEVKGDKLVYEPNGWGDVYEKETE